MKNKIILSALLMALVPSLHAVSITGFGTAVIEMDTLAITNNETIGGACAITGNATVGGNLGVTGNTSLGGTCSVSGNTTLGGIVYMGTVPKSTVTAAGVLQTPSAVIAGAATIGTTLGVTGKTTATGGIDAPAQSTFGTLPNVSTFSSAGALATPSIAIAGSASAGSLAVGTTQAAITSGGLLQLPVNNSGLTAYGGGLFYSNTTSSVVPAGSNDFVTYTLAANALSRNGQDLFIICGGSVADNGNSKTAVLLIDGTVISSVTASTDIGAWTVRAEIIRTGASAEVVGYNGASMGSSFLNYRTVAASGILALDTATTHTITCGEQSGLAWGDLTKQYFTLHWDGQ